MTDDPPTLYHFSCDHGAPLIDGDLVLRPNPQPGLPGVSLVWLTDLDSPDVAGLGLTRGTLITCDRTRHRFVVADPSGCIPWLALARLLPPHLRDAYEADAPGRLPRHWWISSAPVPVLPGVSA